MTARETKCPGTSRKNRLRLRLLDLQISRHRKDRGRVTMGSFPQSKIQFLFPVPQSLPSTSLSAGDKRYRCSQLRDTHKEK